jgi:hypothetical protein
MLNFIIVNQNFVLNLSQGELVSNKRLFSTKKLKIISCSQIMKKYILSLRGINVRNSRIKLPNLTLSFKNMSLEVVKTYLQTGSMVLESVRIMAKIKLILESRLS